jgi:hypothetical protein
MASHALPSCRKNLQVTNVTNSSIIDFEMWEETKDVFPNETRELQRWGLVRTPPKQWFEIWFSQNQ